MRETASYHTNIILRNHVWPGSSSSFIAVNTLDTWCFTISSLTCCICQLQQLFYYSFCMKKTALQASYASQMQTQHPNIPVAHATTCLKPTQILTHHQLHYMVQQNTAAELQQSQAWSTENQRTLQQDPTSAYNQFPTASDSHIVDPSKPIVTQIQLLRYQLESLEAQLHSNQAGR